ISVAATPVANVTVNLPAPITIHVEQPPIDETLAQPPPTEFFAHGVGPTEMAVRWPYLINGSTVSSVLIERRQVDQPHWVTLGSFDQNTAEGWTGHGLFITDTGLQPSTDYVYRFSYLTENGVRSGPSTQISGHSEAPLLQFNVIDATAAIGNSPGAKIAPKGS